jgi:type IV secretory pathway component VirB8
MPKFKVAFPVRESRETKKDPQIAVPPLPPSMMMWHWTLKQLRFYQVLSMSLLCAALLFAGLYGIAAQKVQVRYVEFSQSRDHFFKVYPSSALSSTDRALLTRKAMRGYVEDRNSVNDIDFESRFLRVRAMTDTEIFRAARDQHQKAYDLLGHGRATREVIVTHDFEVQPGVHQVEFKTLDRSQEGAVLGTGEWIANIKYQFTKDPIADADVLLNPLNIKVMRFAIAEKASAPQKPAVKE